MPAKTPCLVVQSPCRVLTDRNCLAIGYPMATTTRSRESRAAEIERNLPPTPRPITRRNLPAPYEISPRVRLLSRRLLRTHSEVHEPLLAASALDFGCADEATKAIALEFL
ncbi:hypothetical protein THAOC_36585 [Thalassiosira oceanica]|uniref:Uncharacterized protein n=1 Tax=Thalassiosira oceanica TaxID=159749 RepID=K0R1N1_THAOC|nr:hypothetical protein THAOC_36585 [Thalassiosira oceanica]|eukprot:EJK44844.1 hypothetical protein THAOC_36585 [Thalassiosira oceanica]